MFNRKTPSPTFGQRRLGDITITPHEASAGYPVDVYISEFDANSNIILSVLHPASQKYVLNQEYHLESSQSKVVLNTEGYPKGDFYVKVMGIAGGKEANAEAVLSIK